MKLEAALLSNAAEVSGNLLYVLGAAFEYADRPGGLPTDNTLTVAGAFIHEDSDPDNIAVTLSALDPNGSEVGRSEHLLKVEDRAAPSPRRRGFAIRLTFRAIEAGIYTVTVTAEGQAMDLPLRMR